MNFHPKVALAFCCWSFCCELGNADTKKLSTNPMLTINPKQTIISIWIYPAQSLLDSELCNLCFINI